MQYSESHIEQMWQMVKLVHELQDRPVQWKLTEPFLQALQDFLHIPDRREMFLMKFMDAAIDGTTCADTLIGYCTHYDFNLFLPKVVIQQQ